MEIVISSFFFCFLIYLLFNSFRGVYLNEKYIEELYYVDDLFEFNYLNRVKILQFFSDKNNFNRLKVLLDDNNDLINKIKNLFQNNKMINQHYINEKNNHKNDCQGYFNLDSPIKYDMIINDYNFHTNLGQLHVFKWLIENDYLLHIY